MVIIAIDPLASPVHLCLYIKPIPYDVYISPLLYCQARINVNLSYYHYQLTNVKSRGSGSRSDDRNRKEKKERTADFALLSTEKKQTKPVKGNGRGEHANKEQMQYDEDTEK